MLARGAACALGLNIATNPMAISQREVCIVPISCSDFAVRKSITVHGLSKTQAEERLG